MGNVIEVQYMEHRNNKQTVQMIDKDTMLVLSTGEKIEVSHGETRQDNKKGLYKTFANARALINTNVTEPKNVRWITLTYAENMTDTKRLYTDFVKFNKRFKRYCDRNSWTVPEYIVMMEPQGRGAWHCHLLYIWKHTAPFIPNQDMAKMWGQGFTKTKKLECVDNVGAYLTAYLGDMELGEFCDVAQSENIDLKGEIKEVSIIDDDGQVIRKKYVKGARLNLYPANFNMIRHSKGVKQPTVEMLSKEMVEKKVSAATKTFEKTIALADDTFENIINYEYYNLIRKENQTLETR